MQYIDNFLNKVTMYKLVLYGLQGLVVISIILGFTGVLSYGGVSLLLSYIVLAVACYGTNQGLAKVFKVQTNVESESITAAILFFVCLPATTTMEAGVLVLVGIIAMVSKYVLVLKKKHIFNPAAVSVFILGLFGSGIVGWWVGSAVLLLPVAVLGFLVLRKVRRFTLFFSFLATSIMSIIGFSFAYGVSPSESLALVFTSWPIIFFGTIMLTEPLTTPPTRKLQVIYGVIVGFLFGAQFHVGPLYTTPELALIIGNIFSFIVSPRARLRLKLLEKNPQTQDVVDFVWKPDEKFTWKPGQYLEWTLGHTKPDLRGNRRYFTIASSPTEGNLILGTKFYPKPSTWKQKLTSLSLGDEMIASQLSGEFTMPEDKTKKLAFIAGGIGTTPFRSMAKYMIDTKEKRDIVYLYSNKSMTDAAYKDIFDTAERESGWKNIYVVNELGNMSHASNMRVGFITKDTILKDIPDYKERMFYISGTHGMVTTFQKILKELGVPRGNIKIDFFPGFV